MGFLKRLYRKFEIRHRKKDTDEEISKVIQIKDYGNYHIEIIYMNDYINKNFLVINKEEDKESIYHTIHPYVVFLVSIELEKDVIDDYYNNLLPVLKTLSYVNHIDTIKDDGRLYSLIGIYGESFIELFESYHDGKDVSYILSTMISLFNSYCNNEFCKDYIPYNLLNEVDELSYITPIRSYKFSDNNIIYMDKIPNVQYKEKENVFTTDQLLHMTNIAIYRKDWVNTPSKPIYTSILYKAVPLLNTIFNNSKSMEKYKDIIHQLQNDSYFTINGKNLLKYTQHCKLIKYNISSESDYLYDDIDEVIEDKTDNSVAAFNESNIDDDSSIDEY